MADTTVATVSNGVGAVPLDKQQLLDYLQREAERARTKIESQIPAEAGGLRGRYDACERLRKQISPLKTEDIAKASEAGVWKDEPFPFATEDRLAELQNELTIG